MSMVKDFKKGVQIKFYKNVIEWQSSLNINFLRDSKIKDSSETELDESASQCFGKSINGEMISVLDILNSTSDGKQLMSIYEEKKQFEVCQRNWLCNTIVEFIFKKRFSPGSALTVKECSIISKQIANLFPGESTVC